MPYAERLTVPLRWWVQGTMLVAALWFAIAVAIPSILAAALIALVFAALVAAALLGFGRARIIVDATELHAGRAHIALAHIGRVEALDAGNTRRVAGVDADARAYLLLRPYLKCAVRVFIEDDSDPAPYWLISTRHPERLAAALSTLATR